MSLNPQTFEAETITEALIKVRMALGPEAMILETKRIRKGFLGIGREKIRVTAGVKDERIAAREEFHTVIGALKNISGELEELLRGAKNNPASLAKAAESPIWAHADSALIRAGLAPELSKELLSALRLNLGNSPTAEGVRDALKKDLKSSLTLAEPLEMQGIRSLAVVGPTGVGKTTTIAKLASRYVIDKNKSVALISIDTFRIAALEQLRTYAEILGVPFEAAFTPHELSVSLRRHSDKDMIFIDTVGHSPYNAHQLESLKQFITIGAPDAVALATSLSYSTEVREVGSRYLPLRPCGLIVTKFDETTRYWGLINLLRSTKLGLLYVTAGQNVPEDIESARIDSLAETLMRSLELKDT